MIRPKIVFESQKSPLGPQQVKNDPKIKSKSKVRIEENIENKSCPTAQLDPEYVFEPNSDDPKIKSKSKVICLS